MIPSTTWPVPPSGRRTARLAPLLALFVLWSACTDGPAGPVPVEPEVAMVEVTAAADTLTALGQTVQLEARAFDADGILIEGETVAWASSDTGILSVDASGLAESLANGAAEVEATIGGVTGSAPLVVAQAVTTMTITPATAVLVTAGSAQQFSVVATDANGNEVADSPILWQSSDHTVAIVDGSGSATARGSGESTITASAQGVPGTAVLTVDQAADRLAFLSQPGDGVAGVALSPAIQVEVRDADGSRVRDANGPVTLSLATNPDDLGTLHGTLTANAIDGVASFSGLWMDRAIDGYSLEASMPETAAATSGTFAVSHAEASMLAFEVDPGSAEAGVPLDPAVVVRVQDEFGNLVLSAANEVTLALEDTEFNFDITGETNVAADGGIATFDAATIASPWYGYRMRAASPGLEPVVSQPFDATVEFTAVAAGSSTCALSVRGRVYCWGDNEDRLLGVGPAGFGADQAVFSPLPVLGDLEATVLIAGDELMCALDADGMAWCWGDNGDGDAGVGHRNDLYEPTPVLHDYQYTDLASGEYHTCGLRTDQRLYCWGYNSNGQLGDSTQTARYEPGPTHSDGVYTAVATGRYHTCALDDDGAAWCWGGNYDGQLGDASTSRRLAPTMVTDTLEFTAITAGGYHTCALGTDDELYCWGTNYEGQLGVSEPDSYTSPVHVDAPTTFVSIHAGAYFTCGIDASGTAWCWGDNDVGQVGSGSMEVLIFEPTQVAGGHTFTSLTAGEYHACGVTSDDGVWCWGDGDDGALGTGGHMGFAWEPVRVVH